MTKKRINELTNYSIYKDAPIPEGGDITKEEFDQGYHYCYDWDGLFIEPNSLEWECCTCHPLKEEEWKI